MDKLKRQGLKDRKENKMEEQSVWTEELYRMKAVELAVDYADGLSGNINVTKQDLLTLADQIYVYIKTGKFVPGV